MAEGPDRRAFEIVTAPIGAKAAEFRDVARTVIGVRHARGFLRDMRARYPEIGTLSSNERGPGAAGRAAQAPLLPDPATTAGIRKMLGRQTATR